MQAYKVACNTRVLFVRWLIAFFSAFSRLFLFSGGARIAGRKRKGGGRRGTGAASSGSCATAWRSCKKRELDTFCTLVGFLRASAGCCAAAGSGGSSCGPSFLSPPLLSFLLVLAGDGRGTRFAALLLSPGRLAPSMYRDAARLPRGWKRGRQRWRDVLSVAW